MYCDLHTHSTASDGTTPPRDLPRLAKQAGLAALALTDHDTAAGVPACAAACKQLGIAFVPGIELSANPAAIKPDLAQQSPQPRLGSLHILGLFVEYDDPQLLEVQKRVQEARRQRNPQIIANLQELGVRIEYEEVLVLVDGSEERIVGRPHIAQILVAKGYAKSVQDAFSRYIGEGKPAYARKDHLPPDRAIEAIHHAGGLAILAHPVQLRYESLADLELIIKRLQQIGLDGIETLHSDHKPADTENLTRLAQKFNLLTSGGSDYHGQRKPINLGSQQVPIDTYHQLREAAETRRQR